MPRISEGAPPLPSIPTRSCAGKPKHAVGRYSTFLGKHTMFDSIIRRVRAFMGSGPDTTVVKEPRIYTKEEHGISPDLVSWEAKRTCELLHARGFRAYIVGGAVRDLLLASSRRISTWPRTPRPNR